MPLEPLICRSRYGNVKESYKITEKFAESEIIRIFVVLEKTRCITCSTWNNKNRKIMRNDWKPRFKCTFKLFYADGRYDIDSMWFAATSREAARRQARKYLKETYYSFEIISISY